MIYIISDFGFDSLYLSQMLSIINKISPHSEVKYLSLIESFNIIQASLLIKQIAKYTVIGTIFVGVVDPGVGSERRSLICIGKKHIFVGPDNGIFYPALYEQGVKEIIEIDVSSLPYKEISKTFHGRDVYAIVAALLDIGFKPDLFGKKIEFNDIVKIETEFAKIKENIIEGKIILKDNFGNLITNIDSETLSKLKITYGAKLLISFKKNKKEFFIPFVDTYSRVPPNMPLALINSFNLLEFAVNKGNANDFFGVKVGDEFYLLKIENDNHRR